MLRVEAERLEFRERVIGDLLRRRLAGDVRLARHRLHVFLQPRGVRHLPELLFALPLCRDGIIRKSANRPRLCDGSVDWRQCKSDRPGETEELFASGNYKPELIAEYPRRHDAHDLGPDFVSDCRRCRRSAQTPGRALRRRAAAKDDRQLGARCDRGERFQESGEARASPTWRRTARHRSRSKRSRGWAAARWPRSSYDEAMTYAARTYEIVEEQLKTRKLDDESAPADRARRGDRSAGARARRTGHALRRR